MLPNPDNSRARQPAGRLVAGRGLRYRFLDARVLQAGIVRQVADAASAAFAAPAPSTARRVVRDYDRRAGITTHSVARTDPMWAPTASSFGNLGLPIGRTASTCSRRRRARGVGRAPCRHRCRALARRWRPTRRSIAMAGRHPTMASSSRPTNGPGRSAIRSAAPTRTMARQSRRHASAKAGRRCAGLDRRSCSTGIFSPQRCLPAPLRPSRLLTVGHVDPRRRFRSVQRGDLRQRNQPRPVGRPGIRTARRNWTTPTGTRARTASISPDPALSQHGG